MRPRLVLGLAVALAGLLLIGTDAWALRHFGAQASAASNPDSYLNAIACPSAAQCWAVGQRAIARGGNTNSEFRAPLISHETDGHWGQVAVPRADGRLEALQDVTCPGANDCWAVGGSAAGGPPIIEHWNGTHWKLAGSPAISGGQLNSVSCASRSPCWALGGSQSGRGVTRDILERLAGPRWRRAHQVGGLLPRHIACAPDGTCMAVGWRAGQAGAGQAGAGQAGAGQAGAEMYRDGRWSPATMPAGPLGRAVPAFLACMSQTECLAVFPASLHGTRAVTAVWNGSAWTPRPGSLSPYLVSLGCAQGRGCWLAGMTIRSRPLLLHWSGVRWLPVAMTSAQPAAVLNGFACGSTCWAVGGAGGSQGDGGSYSQTFVRAVAVSP